MVAVSHGHTKQAPVGHRMKVEFDKGWCLWHYPDEIRCQAIHLRGFSAAVHGKKFVDYLALDDEEDARKAVRVLKRL